MLGKQQVAPSLADRVVVRCRELHQHMTALGISAKLRLLATRRRSGNLPGAGGTRQCRIVRSPIHRAGRRHPNKPVTRQLADQQVADGVMAMHQQRPDDLIVAPVLGVGRQAERSSIGRCVGPAKIALGPHVEQPPGQPVAMTGHAVGLHHHKSVRAHRDERAQLPNLPRITDPKNRGRHEAASDVPQGVTNSGTGPDPDHLVTQRRQRPRNRRLADPRRFNDLAGSHRSLTEQQANRVGVARHGDE